MSNISVDANKNEISIEPRGAPLEVDDVPVTVSYCFVTPAMVIPVYLEVKP